MIAARSIGLLGLGLLLACSVANDPLPPQAEPSRVDPGQVERGAEWFAAFCVSCHGADARGNGPRASWMDPPPADLTRIAARNGGRFDPAVVGSYIDGRAPIESHGPSNMPVWGRDFDDRNEAMESEERRLSPVAIHQIVEYLRTLQTTGE